MSWSRSPVERRYDQSAFVVDDRWHHDNWSRKDLRAELADRLRRQLDADQLVVDHYRVGYRWAFRLPLAARPGTASAPKLPAGIPGMRRYPWLTWVTWELTERWNVLAAAWTLDSDPTAASLLQRELAALDGWQDFREWHDEVGLTTGHLAMALATGLQLGGQATPSAAAGVPSWDPSLRASAENAARRLLDQHVPEWFTATWLDGTSLLNIPIIVLCSVAALARVTAHQDAARYERRAVTAINDWFTARQFDHHTEQSAYNGYLFDTVTSWLDVSRTAHCPAAAQISTWREPLLDLCLEWVHQTVPGRTDLAVPLGDVEAEMTMWLACVARLERWYGSIGTGASWALRRCAPDRLPAAAVASCLSAADVAAVLPETGLFEMPAAIAVRHGWSYDDPAVTVALSRADVGHLHHDNGHVVLAWRGRCWVTDPGYQQYQPGPERDYTLGTSAHNAPVINDIAQTHKSGTIAGFEPLVLELTQCYEQLPSDLAVRRGVRLSLDGLFVEDHIGVASSGSSDVEVTTSWMAGAGLAWSFIDGWLRLSDGGAAIWCGTGTDEAGFDRLDPDRSERDLGSRGPVTFSHTSRVGVRRWSFVLDRDHGWTPPTW